MNNYIETTVKLVGTYPIVWDVVNEAIDDNTNNFIKESPWKHVDDFVCKAFKAAKSAAPTVGRFYNDYNILANSGWEKKKSNNVYKLVKDLHDRDCGITGVGLQAHIDTKFNEWDGVKANMKRYQDLGLDIHITELDVKCKNCGEKWSDSDL
jgi:endo-1,4-beta-xylanase